MRAEARARAGDLAETCGDPRATAAALYAGAIIDMNTDRPERAWQRSEEGLRLFEQIGDARGVADILDARAMAVFLDGRNREAEAAFDRVARLFSDVGDRLRVVTPRSTRGHCLVFTARPADALRESEQVLDLARSRHHASPAYSSAATTALPALATRATVTTPAASARLSVRNSSAGAAT